MRIGCWLISLVVAAAGARPALAQAVDLSEPPLTGSCLRCELALELKGKITVQQEGTPRSFPHEALATHVYLERVLDGTAGAEKVARLYSSAEGTIIFNGQASKRTLRPERSFLLVHRVKDQLVPFTHKGKLTRAELDMTQHFDALSVPGLLPGKKVEVGATWNLSNPVVTQLCDLEALVEHDLACKLDEVKDNRARVSVAGSASGVAQGAAVKLLVTAAYEYDVEAKRITSVEWKQSDQRETGPVSPALAADVVIRLKRAVVPEPAELGDTALAPVQEYDTPPARLTNIVYRNPKDRFVLEHTRSWHAVSPDASEQLVLRLMDRGQFVAQATVTPWKKVEPKEALNLNDFAELMSKTPGWEEERIDEQTELKDAPEGQRIYRIQAAGDLNGVKSVVAFYLLISRHGEQVMVTFTMLPTLAANLRERDLEMVRNFTFPEGK